MILRWFKNIVPSRLANRLWPPPPPEPNLTRSHLLQHGFRPVYVMGDGGTTEVAYGQLGWMVVDEGRCWRFKLDSLDAHTDFSDALFMVVGEVDHLVRQVVIADGCCWMSEHDLVLDRVTPADLLAWLAPSHVHWEVAALDLGVGVLGVWVDDEDDLI